MAEESDQTDKTEEPTAKRLEKAREEGQFLRSQDTSIAVLLISVSTVIYLLGGAAGQAFVDLLKQVFRFNNALIESPMIVVSTFSTLLYECMLLISPIFFMTVLLAILTAYFTGGIGFSVKAFFPKASKLNPISGLGRMFGIKSLVELIKSFTKLSLIGAIIVVLLYSLNDRVFFLNMLPIEVALYSGLEILSWGILMITMSLLIVAAIDLPYQIVSFKNKLKMTRQEVKDEFKESEGRPEVKAKIRERQRAAAMNQMMAAIADADVVVTNPNHFAIALSYEPNSLKAPVVLAKGVDLLAETIKERARTSSVPIFESPYLARAIYFTTDIEEEVPASLYKAVAEVLAYVYQLNELIKSKSALQKPMVTVPNHMKFSESGELLES